MDNVIHLKLNTAKEELIVEKITNAMSKIYEKRQEIDFDKQVQRNKDAYQGIVDPNKWGPWEGSAKYNMRMVMTHTDVVSIKALRQSVGIHPMTLLEPKPDEKNAEIPKLRDREDRLDYILRKRLDIEKLLKSGVYREACVQGTSFVKLCHTREVENLTYNKVYSPEDIEEYKRDSWQKLNHSGDKRIENIQKLIDGEDVVVKINEEKETYYGPKAYRVPIENLFVRPDLKMDRQRLVAEKLNYTWKDIQNRLDTEYFRKKGVDKITGEFEEDYWSRDYSLYECILYAKIDKKFQRYVITYEPESKAILRAIHYPYKHGKVYYIPYYIKERDDSVYGYSITDMISDYSDVTDDIVNSMIDRFSLDNNPVLQIPTDSDLDSYDWGPNSWLPADKPINVLNPKTRTIDEGNLLGIVKSLAQTVDGVAAQQLSGQGSPSDPKGPAVKMAMQNEASNFRIEDYIINLQYGNEMLAEQTEALMDQYSPDETSYMKGEMKEVDIEQLKVPVMYKAHGTSLNINKSQQLMVIKDYIGMLQALAPDILQDPKKRKMLLELYTNNLGGVIEEMKSDLLPEQIAPLAQATGQMDIKESVRGAYERMSPEEQEQIKSELATLQEGE